VYLLKNEQKNYFRAIGGQQKHATHPTLSYWWAAKTRYPPYIDLLVGSKNTLLIYWWAAKTRYPPYIDLLVGSKNTLLIYWWAAKTRYPPYIDTIGGQQSLPTLHKSHVFITSKYHHFIKSDVQYALKILFIIKLNGELNGID